MLQDDILALLKENQGAYLSGEAMSRSLGVSRAAVWKAVDGLRRAGYEVSSGSNRGYQLEASPDKLSAGELAGALQGRVVGRSLVCLEQVDSTNNEAKRRAVEGAPEGLVVIAEEQTGGRGRRGRSFQSPAGQGLYMTVLLRPQAELSQVASFTAWTAVAVCSGIAAACGVRPGIKWTNDLVVEGKKLCGILTELGLEGESHRLDYLAVGIGINVYQQPSDFDPQVAQVATSLAQVLAQPPRRADLAASVLTALDEMYAAFPTQKQDYLAQYRANCLTLGHQVRLLGPGRGETAFAQALDDDFGLVVRHQDGSLETVTAGEVSVRGLFGYAQA